MTRGGQDDEGDRLRLKLSAVSLFLGRPPFTHRNPHVGSSVEYKSHCKTVGVAPCRR